MVETPKCSEVKIPTRFCIGFLMFLSVFFSYMLRTNISISIIAMSTGTISTNITLPDYGPRYDWRAYEQGLILSAYFYGYTIGNLPSGYIAEKIGPRIYMGLCSALCAILNLFTPVAAPSFWTSFTIRLLMGFFAGCVFPSAHSLIAKWSPPNERSKFIGGLTGGSLGTAVTWPMCGMIIEAIGWQYVFYVTGALCMLFSLSWIVFVYDSPAKHPRITKAEREYIEGELVGLSDSAKLVPPYLRILTSLPFWSLLILQFGNMWGLYFILTAAPKFMNEVLGFNMEKTGFLAVLPNLCRFCAGIMFGFIGDFVRSKEWISTTCARKLFCIVSHIIPGLFLIAINYTADPYYCVLFMALSMGFNGASVLTTMQNSQDLSPNYTATIYGIMNAAGTTAGFITPMVVAYFTRDNNTIKEWEMIFIIGAIAYILPAVIYFVFGSGETQSWNERQLKGQQSQRSVATVKIIDIDIVDEKELSTKF